MRSFKPDLIVEVTSACNRACSGCYAPNVVSNESAADLIKRDPSLFLDLGKLRNLIETWPTFYPSTISIRGGEPSLHPVLPNIIFELTKFNSKIIMETHGRWLLDKNKTPYIGLLNALSMSGSTVKVSFDSMHGLKVEDLKSITTLLSSSGINYLVAITEKSDQELMTTRQLCSWVPDEKVIFQNKAEKDEDLVKPSVGVINVRAELVATLNSKFDIRDMIQEFAI